MPESKKIYGNYFLKAVAWLVGASAFAIAPFIFLHIINVMSEENMAVREIDHLVKGAFILFSCCAITGSIVFDFIVSPIKIKGWLRVMVIYLSPFLLIAYLFLQYLVVYIQYEEVHAFGPGSSTITITIFYTIVYSLFAKTVYYKNKIAA